MKCTKYLHGTWSLLNILMIFGIKEKWIILTHTMYCCLLLQIYLCYLWLLLCSRVTNTLKATYSAFKIHLISSWIINHRNAVIKYHQDDQVNLVCIFLFPSLIYFQASSCLWFSLSFIQCCQLLSLTYRWGFLRKMKLLLPVCSVLVSDWLV